MKYILGIDPGWSGGMALINKEGELIAFDKFTKLTETEIIELVDEYIDTYQPVVYLEKVWGRGGTAANTMFKFGWNYGLLRGRIIGRARLIEVTPQKWQTALGCLTGGDKKVSRAKAQELFPGTTPKITNDVADAVLIAEYGRQK